MTRALETRRAALDGLGPAGAVEALCARLRAEHHEITVGQEIRATELVCRLADAGLDIADGASAAHWLAPVLAIHRSEADPVRHAIERWWDDSTPAPGDEAPERSPVETVAEQQDDRWRLARWLGGASLVVAIASIALVPAVREGGTKV